MKAQNDKFLNYNDTLPCHTERSEVSTISIKNSKKSHKKFTKSILKFHASVKKKKKKIAKVFQKVTENTKFLRNLQKIVNFLSI